MNKLVLIFFLTISVSCSAQSQPVYDSITISRFLFSEKTYFAKWKDSLKANVFSKYLMEEKTYWVRPEKLFRAPVPVFSLLYKIKLNGTGDISGCFIPRHSMNFYKGGKIIRFLLVCFECEGLSFSDDPVKKSVRNISSREKQMAELKIIFKDLL